MTTKNYRTREPVLVFLNFLGALESILRNEFRQPIQPVLEFLNNQWGQGTE